MNMRAMVLTAATAGIVLLAACSKVTQENFAKVQNGMPEPDVKKLLGPPTSTSSVQVLGISGTHSIWEAGGAVVSIHFVNGKVATKSYSKLDKKK